METREPCFENTGTIFSKYIERARNRSEHPELSFGLPALDAYTFGIPKERVTIIAARPSEGKTSFALQAAFKIADQNKTVAFISLEDDREQLVEKIFCNICEVDNYEIKRGISEQIAPKVPTAEKIFENLRLVVMDGFGYNFEEFKNVVKSVEPKPEIVFLDYIQMLDMTSKDMWSTISEFIRRVKKFALEEKIAVVILSQINRGAADAGRPGLHHLKQAGTLEEVADLVLILYYPFRHNDSSFDGRIEHAPVDYLEVQIEKNKTGRIGVIPVKFIGRHYRFEPREEIDHV